MSESWMGLHGNATWSLARGHSVHVRSGNYAARQSFLDAEILIRTESGGYRISISELELLFGAHAVVMEGPLPGEYCPKVYRGATCKSKRVCTCGTFVQRAECPHVYFVAGLQGEMDLGHFPEKRKQGHPDQDPSLLGLKPFQAALARNMNVSVASLDKVLSPCPPWGELAALHENMDVNVDAWLAGTDNPCETWTHALEEDARRVMHDESQGEVCARETIATELAEQVKASALIAEATTAPRTQLELVAGLIRFSRIVARVKPDVLQLVVECWRLWLEFVVWCGEGGVQRHCRALVLQEQVPGAKAAWNSAAESSAGFSSSVLLDWKALARIEGVVTEIQRELNEVKVLSDSFEEPGTQSTLLAPTLAHVGVGELMHVAGGISPVGSRTKVLGSHVSGHGATLLHPLQPAGSVSPAYLYPAGTPRQTHSWHRELEERKWRANAEHILMIESSWAQRAKEAEEAASRSDERARVAEEAHGRLLREKAEMADAAQARARQLADEQEKYTSLEARETSLQATLSALEERAASADKLAAEHRAEQAAVADELDMVSGRFEEQLQHSMELKKELSRSRAETLCVRTI
ncbi:unnamed protein product [Symbiodinium necroappetens]|uniref:SWIM-type domain-containing protein n=1 Tax=Symbiodinium necroappetens TaxID=1628268 RepID=A0A813BLX1_9DINO|nr:unnamed protein product [Symbiodinium necroappetens]